MRQGKDAVDRAANKALRLARKTDADVVDATDRGDDVNFVTDSRAAVRTEIAVEISLCLG